MTQKPALASMDMEDIRALCAAWGEAPYRAAQIYAWLVKGARPADMHNLPKALRERLAELPYGGARIFETRVSPKDGTRKYLFSLEDGNLVEGVFMRYHYGNTLCISTQVGCRMGCAFCASTLEGCIRSLSAGEMLGFLSCVEADVPADAGRERSVTNIVLMGSGEPLDNYDEVLRFLRMATDPAGRNISARNISLSTCGLVPQMERFTREAPHVTLSVSLHAPNDAIRAQIMPVSKRYPMDRLLAAARAYADTTGRRVIFEYALIEGLNASEEAARELSARLRGINCHVNLIPLNPVKERGLRGATRQQAARFQKELEKRGLSATIRREMGADIEGACGQLRRSVLQSSVLRQGELEP